VTPAGEALWFWWIVGCAVGSFLNVCIFRLPREQSLIRPASRCPACKRPIAWYDNIPVLSYVLLRGACRRCRKPISWRYPLVELLTGFMTVAVVHRFGSGAVGLIYAAFVWALIVSSFIDLDFRIIPDEISLGGLVVGVAASLLIPALHGADSRLLSLGRSVVGLLVGGGVLYLTGLIGDFLFKKESMGGGDIKLLAMAGSILGWKPVTLTFFLAPLLALGPGLFVLLRKKSHEIPYGPFLALAMVLSLFYGDALIRWSGIDVTIQTLREIYGWGY